MTKKIIIGVLALLVIVGGGAFAYTKFKPKPQVTEDKPAKKQRVERVNTLEVAQRPYVEIAPAEGNKVSLTVFNLKKPADNVEYELEYQAGSLLQAAIDTIALNSLPANHVELLGSCSAGGACTLHKEVKGGTLLLRFDDGGDGYALKSDWKYIENTARENQVSSRDAKFQLEADALKKTSLLVVYNSPGYPEGLTGTLVSDIYSLTSLSALSGEGTLTIRATEEGDLTIMGWDGSAWKEFETKTDGKAATAEVELMRAYVVVKK